jgi:Holliday junction DNA helicase RuvB
MDMTVFDVSEQMVRPDSWDEYIGQDALKRDLDIVITAAKRDGRRLDHILLTATPGAGKTAIAKLIADRMDVDFEYVKLPIKPNDFFDLMELSEDMVVMLDEVHNANAAFQELLLTALEGGVLITPSGFRIDVSTITFIAATTTAQKDLLSKPLRERFEIHPVWAPYTDDEMKQILLGMASRCYFEMPEELATGLARATGGTPRFAKRLVKRARDLGPDTSAAEVLRLVGVDEDGLDANHWEYIRVLNAMGGRAGLANLKAMLQRSTATIEDLERLLVFRGYIRFEPSGRKLTADAIRKLRARDKEVA